MKTAVMDEILRQKRPGPEGRRCEASLAGEIGKAFEKLGDPMSPRSKPDNRRRGGRRALARSCPPEERANGPG